MQLTEWREAGRVFDYNGQQIFFRDEGSGPALICIHGFPTASWDWHKIWPQLIKRFRVIAIDMIGFGFSAKPRDYTYSILDQATLHEKVLAHFGIDFVHVLAHDYGDTVAQELLARFEERRRNSTAGIKIESMCFLNGGLFPEVHRARFVQKLLLSPLGPLLGRRMSERRFGASLAATFGAGTQPSVSERHDLWTLVATNDGPRIAHKLISYIPERQKHRARWVGALQSTKVPLRFINGPADPVSGEHMAARYRELVPSADVVLLGGIGHYPQLEDPEGVLHAYQQFSEPLLPAGSVS